MVTELFYSKLRPNNCIHISKNKFLIGSMNSKALFEWNPNKNKFEPVSFLEEDNDLWLSVDWVNIDDKVYIIPFEAEHLIICDLKTMRNSRFKKEKDFKYSRSFVFNNCIYMIPDGGDEVAIFDCYKQNFRYWDLKINKGITNWINFYCNSIDKAWIVPGERREIFLLNLMDETVHTFKLGLCNNNVVDITGNGNILYFLLDNGSVIGYNMNTAEERLVYSVPYEINMPFLFLEYDQERIFLIPKNSDDIVVINLNGEIITKWSVSYLRDDDGFIFENKHYEKNRSLWLSPLKSGVMVYLDLNNLEKKEIDMKLDILEEMKIMRLGFSADKNREDKNREDIGKGIWHSLNFQ